MLNNMSLKAKLSYSFVLIILFIFIVGFTGWFSMYRTDWYADEQADQKDIVISAERLDRHVYNMRLYGVTGMYNKDMHAEKNSKGEIFYSSNDTYHYYMIKGIDDIVLEAKKDISFIRSKTDEKSSYHNKCAAIEKLFDDYAKITTDWANIQDENLASLKRQQEYQQIIKIRCKDLLDRVDSLMENEDNFTIASKKDVPLKFVRERFVQRQEDLGAVTETSEQIMANVWKLDSATHPETIEATRTEINKLFGEMPALIKKLTDQFTQEQSGIDAQTANANFKLWQQDINEQFLPNKQRQENVLKKITEIGNKITNEVEDIISDATIAANKSGEELDNTAFWSNITILLACVFVVGLGIVLGLGLSSNIAGATSRIIVLLKKVVHEGDISVKVESEMKRRGDEVGELSRTVESIIADYLSVSGLAGKLSDGDWTTSAKEKSEKDEMNINLNSMIRKINASLRSVAETVEKVNTGSREIASASDSLANGATESAASLEEITASMGEVGSQINENAKNSNEARTFAKQASDAGVDGQQIMEKMTVSMQGITQNARDVQNVIKVIDDIAFQTNLLALNAAVEAARAGVHGKGFAVVAEEVRNLASRCAKAAGETSEMIEGNNRQIDAGAQLAGETADMLNKIVEHAAHTSELIEKIAVATSEQAQGIGQINQGLQQIDAVIQQNTASAEETASVSKEMSAQAHELHVLVDFFKI